MSAPSAEVVVPDAPKGAPGKPSPKKKTVRLRGPADLMSRVITKIRAGRPKDTEANRDCTFEVSRSSQTILSKVKYVLSTGLVDYDDATGIGGLPFGRIVEIYGLDGAAKSAMALRCAVRMQMRQIYERVKVGNTDTVELRKVKADVPVFTIYIDNEQSIDDDGKVVIDGVELDVAVARCDTVDQMFKIIDTAIDGVAEFQRETKQECFILAVVDTVAGTSSREEIKSKWEDVDYTRQPKQLREGFRVMTRKISRHNVLGVFTNQVSEKFQKAQGKRGSKSMIPQDDDFSTFGGRALKFFASMRIFHAQSNPRYKLSRDLKFPSGRTIEFTVTKNRLGKPWRSGRMVLLYEGGLNDVFSQLETYIHLKLAERGETGGVKFRFSAAGVETTTFAAAPGEAAERGNPGIESNVEWPAFLQAHADDFDKLRLAARALLFKEQVMPEVEEDEMDGIASEVDVDEET